MRIKLRYILLLAVLVVMLYSCNDTNENVRKESAPNFPTAPDEIVFGNSGEKLTLLPNDEAFDEIVSAICSRVSENNTLDILLLETHEPIKNGKHLSYGLRESETYVEFVYDECRPQNLLMTQSGGSEAKTEQKIKRLFFPLTGENHGIVFVGIDDEYKEGPAIGFLHDNTDLIFYIQKIIVE